MSDAFFLPIWEFTGVTLSQWKQATVGVLSSASEGLSRKDRTTRVIAWATLYLTVHLAEDKATRQYFYNDVN